MISDASPVGTSLLGEEEHRVRARQQAADQRRTSASCAPRDAQRAAAPDDDAAMIAPAAMNRVETASSGGIVSTAIAMKR